MHVIPLSVEHEPLYCACLEDWSDEIKEGGDHKARWLGKDAGQGPPGQAGPRRQRRRSGG
ncbi:MAG: hypothetical protein M0C28_02160 [Candidatus Moduliflexus flocculans]|nr:hypothetical protein [Candidatus Moduliflexus flocculans]